MIDVDSLAVGYGDVAVLEDVSFGAESGEFVGLVGPNGAGKTTLVRAMSGVVEPDDGTVSVDGVDVAGLSSRRSSRLVSVVPQDTHLSFSFDVRDVVEMGRTPHRSRFSPPTTADRELVERALERTETAELADRPIDEVSGGERQRVLLARAIAQDTPVVLLDEPTASLDVNHQIETLELVRELVADGKTAVAAIHDLELAARYCDRLVVLANGTVLECGPAADVLTADVVSRAFDATAAVGTNPVTGTTTVTALSTDRRDGDLPESVHVVGRGPTAAAVLSRLEAAGVDASVGPVSSGDVVTPTARKLGVDRLSVDPFTPVTRETREALDERVRTADVTILADLELSAGNQLVLECLAAANELVVVETRPLAERNYAGERARELYRELRRTAVETSPERVIATLSRTRETEGAVDRDPTGEPTAEPTESNDD